MIRCGWLLTDIATGGPEKVPIVLSPALEQSELTVILLKNRIQHEIRSEGPRIIKLSSRTSSLAVAGGPTLARAARVARQFDVLVAGAEWTPTFFTVASGAIARRPVVATVHTDLRCYRDYEPVPALWWAAMRRALPRCSAVIAVSLDVRASLIELGIRGDLIHVIPNPAPRPKPAKAQHGGRPRVLTVAGLKKVKGVDIALEAAAKLTDLDFEWIFLGDGPELPALTQQAEKLGLSSRVTFAGFHPDPQPFYDASDVYVLPSRAEASPMVLLEAMSAGLPILATRCGAGVAELVDPDVGELVPVSSPDSMARALRSMLTDPVRRERYRYGALQRALDYQPACIAKQYDRVLTDVVAREAGSRL